MGDILDNVVQRANYWSAHLDDSPSLGYAEDGSPVAVEAERDPVRKVAALEPSGSERLDAIIVARAKQGMKLKEGGRGASYSLNPDSGKDWMHVAQASRFASPEVRRGVLAHELVHSTQLALGRPRSGLSWFENMMFQITGEAPRGYVVEELTAELGSVLLLSELGALDEGGAERASIYIGGYLSGLKADTNGALKEAKEKAREAVDYLLSLS